MSCYISPSKVFSHLDRLAGWQAGQKPAPVTVEWDLSNRCSLGCQFCHFAHTHTKGPWAVSDRSLPDGFESCGDLADLSVVRRGLTEMATAGVKAIVWSGGGEPTLHPDWREIVAYASSLGLQQGMYTLGGHLGDGAYLYGRCLTWVVVSLDACDAESYAAEKRVPQERFNQACQGVILLAADKRAVVGVSFLLHRDNWHRTSEMLALGRKLGATYTTFRPAIQTSPANPSVCTEDRQWITDAMPTLEALSLQTDVELDVSRFIEYRDWATRSYSTCYGIRLNATVTPDGRVWVCPQRRGIPGSCVGDLRVESFRTLWDRHVGQWTEFGGCRVSCRLHLLNQQIEPVFKSYTHEAFV